MPDITVRHLNHNCRRAGQQLLQQAIHENEKRVASSNRDVYQSAKDGATYLRRKALGAVTVAGQNFGPAAPVRSDEQMENEGFVRTSRGWKKKYG